jgi:hypothetical protein
MSQKPPEFGLQGLYAVAGVIATLAWLLFSGAGFVWVAGSVATIQFLVSLAGMAALWWAYFEAEREAKQRAIAALASAACVLIVWLPLFLITIESA